MSRLRWTTLGLVLLGLAIVILTNSCRSLPGSPLDSQSLALALAPGATSSPGSPPSPTTGDPRTAVPTIIRIRSLAYGDSLYLFATLSPRGPGSRASYDHSRPGGWMLQVFINSDQSDTGYPWRGTDYLVRGGEKLSQGSYVVRRVESGYGGPGGWGPASGAARLTTGARNFVVAVPLAAIGDDDGHLDFAIETYATVACPECEGGVTQLFAADYFGSTTGTPAAGPLAGSPGSTRADLRPLARSSRLSTGSDTDARW